MSDLVVKRFNMVTVHSNGETYDDMREKPNGEFCRYREANFSHKEIINSMAESDACNQGVNEELLDLVQRANGKNGCHTVAWQEKAKEVLAKALGQ